MSEQKVPLCYGKPSDSPLHGPWQLQRATPDVYYRCKACGAGRYGDE